MKTKRFKKMKWQMAVVIFISASIVTGFAAVGPAGGCPDGSGGYASNGVRTKKTCVETTTENGYWWYVGGEVKWVGAVFGGMRGEYQEASRTLEFTGQEYTCTGDDKVCWVCNCYYANSSAAIE